MKITNKQLKQIIKEELEAVLSEEASMSDALPTVMTYFRQMEQEHDQPDKNLTVGRMLKSKDISSIFNGRMASSPKANKIKVSLNYLMRILKARGLDINQIAELFETAGREVFGEVPDGAIAFIKEKGGSGGSVTIDDPMMQ